MASHFCSCFKINTFVVFVYIKMLAQNDYNMFIKSEELKLTLHIYIYMNYVYNP